MSRKSYLMLSVAAVGRIGRHECLGVAIPHRASISDQAAANLRPKAPSTSVARLKSRHLLRDQRRKGSRQIIIGQMYVQFIDPMVSKLAAHHGARIRLYGVVLSRERRAGTKAGRTTRCAMESRPTSSISRDADDQASTTVVSMRQSMSFNNGDIPGAWPCSRGEALSRPFGLPRGHHWLGRLVRPFRTAAYGNFDHDATAATWSAMARRATRNAPRQPAHCNQLGRLPMEPEAPWAVDQAIKSRTGNGAPAGIGNHNPG